MARVLKEWNNVSNGGLVQFCATILPHVKNQQNAIIEQKFAYFLVFLSCDE